MFNLGFGGQFGGGFIQAPEAAVASAPGGGVTYAINWSKSRPRDDSQRRDRYGGMDSWAIAFPTSPGQQDEQGGVNVTFPVGPITYARTTRRYR